MFSAHHAIPTARAWHVVSYREGGSAFGVMLLIASSTARPAFSAAPGGFSVSFMSRIELSKPLPAFSAGPSCRQPAIGASVIRRTDALQISRVVIVASLFG